MDGISVISDVHIKACGDDAYALLFAFFNHPKVKSSSAIYLLGDIFDLMVGRQKYYLDRYPDYFHLLGTRLNAGQEIHYLEGNHDLHVELNYRDYFRHNQIDDRLFYYHRQPLVKKIWEKTFLFAHGDEIELGNTGYKIYRAMVTSPMAKFLAERVVNSDFIHFWGERASRASRKRNHHHDQGLVQSNFRLAATKQASQGYDYIICGHSHIQDDYTYDGDLPLKFTYLNNGFALDSKTFIYLDDQGHSFINLCHQGLPQSLGG